jgi:hypothetical protein
MAIDNFFEGSDRKRKRGVGAAKKGRDGASGGGSRGGRGGRAMNNGHNDRPNNNYKGKGREEQVPRIVNGDDEDLISDEDADEDDAAGSDNDQVINNEEFESDDEAERKETPAQKRLRLAQQYLDSLKAAQQGGLLLSMLLCSMLLEN